MTDSKIFMVDGDGLREMRPSAPRTEDVMQELVARYPQLITDGDGDLLLIAREAAVGDGYTDSRWSLDHLFVTKEAVPVFVELKRASDTRIRREIVGQLIDYAANGSVHWAAGTIAESFNRGLGEEDPELALAQFIGDRDASKFWDQVDSNLRAGRIKLVFVADRIPKELAIVVEFLNSQMRADVRAIELNWFGDDDGTTTLVPRVFGESEQTTAAKKKSNLPPITVEKWIDERIAPLGVLVREGVEASCQIAESLGGKVFVPSTRGSIIAEWPTKDGKSCYPFGVYPSGKIVLRLGYLKHRPAFADDSSRAALYDKLTSIVGELHTASLAGEPGFSAEFLNNDAVRTDYTEFLDKVIKAATSA